MKLPLVIFLVAALAPLDGFAQSAVDTKGTAGGPPTAQAATPPAPDPDAFYHLGPDSLPQEGVPKGEIRGPFTLPSNAVG
jgi:hypothetical protein